jgi:hypothetical protein
MASKEDYDWLDDPFNDKKNPPKKGMSSGSKAAIGIGCVVVFIGLIVLAVLVIAGAGSLADSL